MHSKSKQSFQKKIRKYSKQIKKKISVTKFDAQTRNYVLVGLLLGILFIISAFATYGYLTYQRVFVGSSRTAQASPTPKPDEPPPPPVYTFALLGHGDPGHDGGLLTDSIMIIKIDTGLEKIGLISVPRDAWVEIPSNGWDEQVGWKVNAAYAIGPSQRQYLNRPEEFQEEAGGGELAKYTLEKVVGFPIDHFVAIDFSGFQKSIDVLGGVDVFVDRSFTDPLYPIPGEEDNSCGRSEEDIAALPATLSASEVEKEFPCRYENLVFTRGTTHMDGEAALKYARSRHAAADGGDFNRARRQRAVLLAVRDRVLALDFFPKIIPFLSKLTYNMRTDISLAKMNEFLGKRDQFLEYEIVGIPLTTDDDNVFEFGFSARGQSILRPKAGEHQWQNIHQYIDLTMQGESTAAARVATASAVVELLPNDH